MRPERFDVIVVGSGAGGAPVAHTLATKGAQVLLLEKGPWHLPDTWLHDEISMCRRDRFVPWAQDDPRVFDRGDGPVRTNEGWISQCVGGGTVHMSGFFFRLHERDFLLASSYTLPRNCTATDWPIRYGDLAPYYDRVERLVGVSGDTRANPFEPPRTGPYPFAPVATHPVSNWIDEVGRAKGLHPYPVPRAIITQSREARRACTYCSLCGSYGCETGAKSSTLAALIPSAEKTGRLTIKSESMAQRIVMLKNGRARGIEYTDPRGALHLAEARVVVLAASAIESARLLLLSACGRFPDGLGNGDGQVGKNLCFSSLGKLSCTLAYEGRTPSEVHMLEDHAPFVGRAIQDFYELDPTRDIFGKGGTFHFLWAHPNPIYAAEQLIHDAAGSLTYGASLVDRLIDRFTKGRRLEVECFSEWLPNKETFVTLDDRATDRFGLPAARITIRRHPSDRAASERLVHEAQRLLEALRGTDIRIESIGGETLVLQHGTCRMGKDPATSVTNAKGRLHEVENVYVTCGGSLPSSASVPTTMTIMANAFRIADGIQSNV